jgi:hypothetical protein
MNYLFLLIILLILSHFYSWYLFFDAAKILDKRLDYITRFIVDATEWIKAHSKDDD